MLCLSRLNTDVLKRTQRKFLFFWRSPFAKDSVQCTLYSSCILLRVAHFEAVTSTCHLVLVVQNKYYASYTGTGQITLVVQEKSYVLHRTNHTCCAGEIMFFCSKNHMHCKGQIIFVVREKIIAAVSDKSYWFCRTNHNCCAAQIMCVVIDKSYLLNRKYHISSAGQIIFVV